jgi:hypothetical protein
MKEYALRGTKQKIKAQTNNLSGKTMHSDRSIH